MPFAHQLGRALRLSNFYDSDHKALAQLIIDTHAAAEGLVARGPVTLGAVGSELFAEDGKLDAPGVREAASLVARHLYSRNVVAVRLLPGLTRVDVAAFVHAMSPSPDELRANGGVRRKLDRHGIIRIIAVEIDLASLHGGAATDLEVLVEGDPVARAAVQRAMQLASQKGAGEAVALVLAPGAGAAELGEFLDRLVTRASSAGLLHARSGTVGAAQRVVGQGVVRPGGSNPPAAGPGGADGGTGAGLTPGGRSAALGAVQAEELARVATEALGQLVADDGATGTPEKLQQAVHVFAGALARLPAEASFAILRDLSQRDTDGGRWPDTVNELSKNVSDDALARVVADTLASRQFDDDSLGQVLFRLRPLEESRRAVLDRTRQVGRGEAGKLVNELQSRLLGDGAVAERFVPLAYRENLKKLKASAMEARKSADGALARLLLHAEPIPTAHRLARAWVRLAQVPQEFDAVAPLAVEALEALEQAGDDVAAAKFIDAAAELAERAGRPHLLATLFEGEQGVLRAERLVVAGVAAKPRYLPALQALLFGNVKVSLRPKVVQAIALQGEKALNRLLEQLPGANASAAQAILEVASLVSPVRAIALCKDELRLSNDAHRIAALRTLALMVPDDGALRLLGQVAGVDHDKGAAAATRLDPKKDAEAIQSVMLAALRALGETRHAASVSVLEQVLHWKKLFDSKLQQALRRGAAEALGRLAASGIGEATNALSLGASNDSSRAVRDECRRVLGRI